MRKRRPWCAIAALAVAPLLGAAISVARNEGARGLVDKVIGMIDELEVKCEEDLHNQKLAYVEYETFCTSAIKETNRSLRKSTLEVEELSAEISQNEAEAEELEGGVQELQTNIASWKNETVFSTQMREKDAADYHRAIKEFEEMASVVKRALTAMKDGQAGAKAAVSEAESLLMIPADLQAAVASLLQADGPPNAGMSFQSGAALKMLEDLKSQAEEQKNQAEQAEITAQRDHAMLLKQNELNIQRAEEAISEKTGAKEECLKRASSLKGDLKISQGSKEEDTAKIQATRSECMEKAVDYDKDQATREDELKALGIAKNILKGEQVSGVADKHITVLLQLRSSRSLRATSLAQNFRGSSSDAEARQRLASLLMQRAEKTGSSRLALVAQHAVSADTKERLAKMIRDMILKLQSELGNMVDQQALCDKELSTNGHTRQTKSAMVEELEATVDKIQAELHTLDPELKDLRESISATELEIGQATDMRREEKARNEATIKEAQDAQVQVTRALKVLENFYAGQASLLQQGTDMGMAMEQVVKAPATRTGVVSMIQVIVEDFAHLEAETTEAEEAALEKFQNFLTESKKDIKTKEVEIRHKESRKDELSTELESVKEELSLTRKELQAALDYYDELQPMCINTNPSYEERSARRKEEMEALRDALQVLDN